MKLRPSRLLQKARSGTLATVLKLNLIEPRIVELAGLSGADAVWLCNEHVPNDWLNLENQIRAAKLYDMDTIVRVSKGAYSDYVKPFECDATGIMVPHISSAEEARHVVDMVRFHPLGRRAVDGGNMDGVFCQIPITQYAQHMNDERFIILQIESPEALEKVDEIAAVPGFDALLFGAGDFSHRIGKLGQVTDPAVVAARKRVAAAALKNGKLVSVASLYGQKDQILEEGATIITLGADVLELGAGFNKLISDFNGAAAVAPTSVYNTK